MHFLINDTATAEIYTLSLPRRSSDLTCGWSAASPAASPPASTSTSCSNGSRSRRGANWSRTCRSGCCSRSEEHTSELQSRQYLACRLLLENKKMLFAIALYDDKESRI